jgi:O-antigen biosynthesis protein
MAALRVRHRIDPAVDGLFPCFYGGGGSCAFDRRKFLELGGFDDLLAPFYLEDTDLGYLAWKRGWKVLYQPRSVVYHEHRGTIGKRFSEERTSRRAQEKLRCCSAGRTFTSGGACGPFLLRLGGRGAERGLRRNDRPPHAALWRAFLRLPRAMRSRWRARSLAAVDDTEAFRRPLGGYFRDRFATMEAAPERAARAVRFALSDLPAHARRRRLHVPDAARDGAAGRGPRAGLLDFAWQEKANLELRQFCASAEWLVRPSGHPKGGGSLLPYAVREFANEDLEWLIHRQIYLRRSTWCSSNTRAGAVSLRLPPHRGGAVRARRLLPIDRPRPGPHDRPRRRIQGARRIPARAALRTARAAPFRPGAGVHGRQSRYLLGFLPRWRRAARPACAPASTSRATSFAPGPRAVHHALLGSFRHDPNRAALDWFVREVLPLIVAREPARAWPSPGPIRRRRTPTPITPPTWKCWAVWTMFASRWRYAVFVCPMLSGSGVRVKLLEAFAAGIPVVSTAIGAEGLAAEDGRFCALADSSGLCRARHRAVRGSGGRRRDGRPRPRRGGSQLGNGRSHPQLGGTWYARNDTRFLGTPKNSVEFPASCKYDHKGP